MSNRGNRFPEWANYLALLEAEKAGTVPGSGVVGQARNALARKKLKQELTKEYRGTRHARPEGLEAALLALPQGDEEGATEALKMVMGGGAFGRTADAAVDVALGAGLRNTLGRVLNPQVPRNVLPMTVFHGSPHKFDKFDLSKIGTGEGAQAFGHGLYVSEDPGVAKSYRMTGEGRYARLSGHLSPKAEFAFDFLEKGESELDLMSRMQKHYGEHASFEDIASAIDEAKKYEPSPGSLYKVDLPDEHIAKMLDWDAPLSEQPEGVRNALSKIGIDVPRARGVIEAERAKLLPELVALENAGQQMTPRGAELRRELDRLAREGNKHVSPMKGEDVIRGRAGALTNANGVVMKPEEALLKAGIPGIKYKAGQLSGGNKSGASNFVVFDDSLLKILERE